MTTLGKLPRNHGRTVLFFSLVLGQESCGFQSALVYRTRYVGRVCAILRSSTTATDEVLEARLFLVSLPATLLPHAGSYHSIVFPQQVSKGLKWSKFLSGPWLYSEERIFERQAMMYWTEWTTPAFPSIEEEACISFHSLHHDGRRTVYSWPSTTIFKVDSEEVIHPTLYPSRPSIQPVSPNLEPFELEIPQHYLAQAPRVPDKQSRGLPRGLSSHFPTSCA